MKSSSKKSSGLEKICTYRNAPLKARSLGNIGATCVLTKPQQAHHLPAVVRQQRAAHRPDRPYPAARMHASKVPQHAAATHQQDSVPCAAPAGCRDTSHSRPSAPCTAPRTAVLLRLKAQARRSVAIPGGVVQRCTSGGSRLCTSMPSWPDKSCHGHRQPHMQRMIH
jgi:hypothetical protein